MRKRIRLLYVIVIAFVIVAGGLMTLNRLDQEIAVLEDTARETRLRQLALETENGNMRQEIAVKDTDSYIRKMARKDNRFLMPGEMPGLEIEAETAEPEPEAEPVQEDTEG